MGRSNVAIANDRDTHSLFNVTDHRPIGRSAMRGKGGLGKQAFEIARKHPPLGAYFGGAQASEAYQNGTLCCLTYIHPATIPPIMPPRDPGAWAELVYQTVRHLNFERGYGVRYLEVWRDPADARLWRGSIDQYLRFYETTARAVKAM